MSAKIIINGSWVSVDEDEVERALDNVTEGRCPVCGERLAVSARFEMDGSYGTLRFCSQQHVREWAEECPTDDDEM